MNHSHGVKTFSAAHTLYLYVPHMCACEVLIAKREDMKLCVGEVKKNNPMHVIHLNNQPMQGIITHCKHLDTLGKILNCNHCLFGCKCKAEKKKT